MKKKFFKYLVVLILLFLPKSVSAGENILARIGNNYYDLLSDAIENAGPNDTITLTSNITLEKTQDINKAITIDLNGKNILGESIVFEVKGGSLTLKGSGIVKEINPYYAPVLIKGSTSLDDHNYSVVNIGKDVFLEGWSGVFIDHNEKKSYGVVANIDGSINSVLDTAGDAGFGVYVNGQIKHKENYPVINIGKSSKITSLGSGIYMAGYSKVTINGGYIEGNDSVVAIKSGNLTINDGTLFCTGRKNIPTDGSLNGVNPSGTTLQIESNDGYASSIEISINGGSLRSKNSNVIYEYLSNASSTKVKNINITGGNFLSDKGLDVFNLSSSFKNTNPNFISGGKYSSDPSSYLKSDYKSVKTDEKYEVVKTTMKEEMVFKEQNKTSFKIPIIIVAIGFIITCLYFIVKKYFII